MYIYTYQYVLHVYSIILCVYMISIISTSIYFLVEHMHRFMHSPPSLVLGRRTAPAFCSKAVVPRCALALLPKDRVRNKHE